MKLPLPVDEVLPALREGNAVLIAPPGAGKTTRVPPALDGKIVMLEPRRIAARAAARRMAEEGGWRLGEEVGYQVRFDRKAGPSTRILVITEGILVQMLQSDPFLEGIGVVIFDEIHERSLHTDLSLAMTRRVQREVRPDLRIVAMSTVDPGPIAAYLDAPVIRSEGRLHPVEIRHLDSSVAAAVRIALKETAGDVLVFLPGVGEIERTAAELSGVAVVPLYGDLPAEKQDEALRPLDRRKVVLATNVAETSITVEGITAVVDSGLVRRLRYDPATGLDRLELGKVSRASADQRAGRAGRQGSGLCLRLWPAWEPLPEREVPEILRVDLATPALQLLAWGETDLTAFDWFEPPDPAALASALLLLRRLGATDEHGVTETGRLLARLPVHPRLGRLLVEGHRLGYPREAALLAALLSERNPFPRAGPSDLLSRLDALEGNWNEEGLNAGAARFVLKARDQLFDIVSKELGPAQARTGRDEALLRALLAAYPDRVARRREPRSLRAVMVGGRGVRLVEESTVLDLFLCIESSPRPPRPAWTTPSPWMTRTFPASFPASAASASMPELGLPGFDETQIRELLPALAAGRKSFAELRRAPLLPVLQGTLSRDQLRAVEREAPERLEVPSGSRIKLVYEPGKPPVLAARIQELFGLAETPRVAAGRVPVLLHLLAPNHRPQQVTHDLKSFWENTYPQVRKELAGRYPKHSWPQDPWNARPERRPGRRS